MPTVYLITGASRGLGFSFLKKLSSNPNSIIVGLVRNRAATEKLIAEELNDRSNIRIVEADLTDYDAVLKSADEVAAITGGSVDYLIANAGLVTTWTSYLPPSVLAQNPVELARDTMEYFRVNVLGNINLYNAYIPLVLKGKGKKVITLSTGHADPDMVTKYNIETAAPYTISKAALNMTVAKFHAEYSEQGVLFMSICPGFVETGQQDNIPPEAAVYLEKLFASFISYAPDMKKSTPEEAVDAVWSVADNASLEKGYGGSFVSHKGNRQWL